MKNKIFFLIGPSGVGKTTVRKLIVAKHNEIKFIPSYTTRQPRDGEIDGEDYFFISVDEFLKLRDTNSLIEWEEHFGNYYGISRDYCEKNIQSNSLIKEIAIGGYKQIVAASILSKDFFHSIFIMPDSIEALIYRLENRGDSDMETRIKSVNEELKTSEDCNSIVISENDNLDKLYENISIIIFQVLR